MSHKNSYYNFENQYRLKGYKYIAGLDEVGRGCWAGPLVAATVILPPNYNNINIKDSKQLSAKKREILFKEITKNALDYQIVFVEPIEVDRLNPKQASIHAMQQAVKQLKIKPDILLIDAEKLNTEYESKSIIKGDQRSLAIAAASILAKVTRDWYMVQIDNKYPQYQFKQNKGYGTLSHLKALKIHGPIKKFHRYSYKPIKTILAQATKKQIQL